MPTTVITIIDKEGDPGIVDIKIEFLPGGEEEDGSHAHKLARNFLKYIRQDCNNPIIQLPKPN